MTWCGYQGFQAPPNNTFLVNGKNMGNWGYEVRLYLFHPLNKKSERQHSHTMVGSQPDIILVLRSPRPSIPSFSLITSTSSLYRVTHFLTHTNSSFPARPVIPPYPLRRARRALRPTSSRLRVRWTLSLGMQGIDSYLYLF